MDYVKSLNYDMKVRFHTQIHPKSHNAKERQEGWSRELLARQHLLLWENNGAHPQKQFLEQKEEKATRNSSQHGFTKVCHAWPSTTAFHNEMARCTKGGQ